jgi:drug/metabolite transporter (DMT)-like permease
MRLSHSGKLFSYLGLSLTVIFWGTSFIATKITLREISPAVVVTFRSIIGFFFFLAVVRLRSISHSISRNELSRLALLGFLGITFHQWLQANGLLTATATVTAWVVATIPVFVAILGWAVLGEQMTRWRIWGIALATAGTVIVVSGGNLFGLVKGQVGTIGDLLVGVSALNWAVFTILSRRFLRTNHSGEEATRVEAGAPIRSLLYVTGFGCAFCLPWVTLDGGWRALPMLSGLGWRALIYLGVACSGLAYLFWYQALERIDAIEAGVFLYFEPLITALFAGPILGESTTYPMLLGGIGILLGVWWVNRR